jgi:hypothetical protein
MTQPCEDTDFSPLTDPLAHPRPAVFLSVVTYIDRVNISVTAHQMMPAYGMTDQEMGQEKKGGRAELAQYA